MVSAPAVANELDTSIVADSRCSGINGPYEICTNNTNGNSGACYGDSGGPQVRRVNGVWNLIGATSRAGNNNSTCATGPSIYVDLPSIRSWISTQVGWPAGLTIKDMRAGARADASPPAACWCHPRSRPMDTVRGISTHPRWTQCLPSSFSR